MDPVDLDPIKPVNHPYVYDSPVYTAGLEFGETSAGQNEDNGWIMGIDEAGRGPVLGPMVYAAAYCPKSFQPTLESLGFDDSKALSPETRDHLWSLFKTHLPLCYSSNTLPAQSISSGMLRRIPINLNRQAEEATIALIQSALNRNIPITECYVDALGPAPQWQARLSAIFPKIKFTVCPKADSLFKIVGAASIVAKVTRDRYVESWVEDDDTMSSDVKAENIKEGIEKQEGEGEDDIIESQADGQKGKNKRKKRKGENDDEDNSTQPSTRVKVENGIGSGYPSDPRTQAYLKERIHPVFGYKEIVRFSWATVRVMLEKQGVECRWNDDTAQSSVASHFGAGADSGRPKMWRDIGVSGVGEL